MASRDVGARHVHVAARLALVELLARSFGIGCAMGASMVAAKQLASIGRKRKRMRPTRSLSMARMMDAPSVGALVVRCGVASAGSALTMRIARQILGRARGLKPYAGSLAACLASCWLAVLPGSTARESGCLVALSQALLVFGRVLLHFRLIPKSTHYAPAIFTLSCFEIMKAW